MSDKPEALQLADSAHVSHRVGWQRKAAAELRRLVTENEALREANEAFGKRQEWWNEKMVALEAINAELVEALRGIVEFVDRPVDGQRPDVWAKRVDQARAALAKVEAST